MKVGYAVLYKDRTLVVSANPIKQFKKFIILSSKKKIYKNYGKFDDDNVPWKKDSKEIKTVQILDYVKSNCMEEWFADCINLTTLINFQNLDVSDCEIFKCTFERCSSLKDISSLQNWDVSNGKDFYHTFGSCKLLTDIKSVQNWNVSSGRSFLGMFCHCTLLETINIKNWNLMNEKNFANFCMNCTNLKKIYLPNSIKVIKENIFLFCNSNLKIVWKDKIYNYSDLEEYKEF